MSHLTAPAAPYWKMPKVENSALQEARRLMLGQNFDATSAAYRVGYDDASHFNREYKRLFGAPPMRDVERLREAAKDGAPA